MNLEHLLLTKIDAKDDDQYIPMAQQAISVIYQLSDNPDTLGGKLCHTLAQKIKSEPKNGLILRRSFFVVGHIAVCQVCLQFISLCSFDYTIQNLFDFLLNCCFTI